MAYSFDPQIIARLLTGIGASASAYGAGSPQWGYAGVQAMDQQAQAAQMRAQQNLQNQLTQQQIQRQQQADADAAAQKAAAKSWLIGQSAPSGLYDGQGRPGPSTATPAALDSIPEAHRSFYQSYANIDPIAAAQMAGQEMLKDPEKPDLQDFYTPDGKAYKGYLDPKTNQPVRVGEFYPRWQPVQPPQLPADIQEYQLDMNQRVAAGQPKIPFSEWKKQASGGDLKYGLNPVYIKNQKTGQIAMLLPNTQGGTQQVNPPDGWEIAPQTQMVDTGTASVPVDKRTGLPVPDAAPIQKDVAGAASQTTQGQAQGQAAADLPAYLSTAQMAINGVDSLLADDITKSDGTVEKGAGKSARQMATGASSYLNIIPGTEAYDWKQQLAQLKGGVFLNAYKGLRGGGAITEIEGQKAQDALARLDTAQSEDAFVRALNDYKAIIQRGIDVAKQRATATPVAPGGSVPVNATPTNPADMSDDDLLKALGQ